MSQQVQELHQLRIHYHFNKMKAINDDGLIGGVCSYLGKHTPLPIWFWRALFVVFPFSSIVYLIIWALIDC